MEFKNIIAVSLLLTSPWIIEAKKVASTQSQSQTNPASSSGQQKSFNGTLINNASQKIQVQFSNSLNQPLTSITTLNTKKQLALPSGTAYINIIVNNKSVVAAPVGAVVNHAGTALRDLSYVVTNTNAQWNIKMA